MPMEAMHGPFLDFPSHLEKAVATALDAVEPVEAPRAVVLTGMGGSGIGGALAAGWLRDRSVMPIIPWHEETAPGFVGSADLVIATSYSGATSETLDASRQAIKAGARFVAITTGGPLAELAKKHRAPFVQVPSGFQPRAATGHLLGAVVGALDGTGAMQGAADELLAAAKAVTDVPHMLWDDAESPAHHLADNLGPDPVDVVGHDVFALIARRFCAQLNENSKVPAAHHPLPEVAHNALVPWCTDAPETTLALIRRENETALEQARYDHINETNQAKKVVEVRIPGDGIEQILRGVLTVDAASLLIAARLGRDPEEIAPIPGLKARLRSVGGG